MRVRRLSELQSEGDVGWFQPALDLIQSVAGDEDSRIRGFLDLEKSIYVARAPGRLDVMGGIADYSGATVLQLPLDRATAVCLQPTAAPRCEIATRRANGWEFFSIETALLTVGALGDPAALATWFAARPDDHWASYAVGVVQLSLGRQARTHGFRLLIDSSVPEGKGVSSSAALEVATMAVVASALGVSMAAEEMAASCQWVENHVVGAPCGIMDQMTSACGRRGRLLRLRCQPGTIEGQLEIPNGYRFFGIDSGVRHAVTGADYGTVRAAAFMGYRMIAELAGFPVSADGGRARIDDSAWHGYLANIPSAEFAARFESRLPEQLAGEEFLARYAGTTDAVTQVLPGRRYPVRVATAHPIHEQDRVMRFAELLDQLSTRPAAAVELGALMAGSHASYGACGLGSDGTDRLVELVAATGPARGLFGAKITGGGSGGTVAVLASADAGRAVDEVAARYTAETGRAAEVFADSGPGADEMGVLILEH